MWFEQVFILGLLHLTFCSAEQFETLALREMKPLNEMSDSTGGSSDLFSTNIQIDSEILALQMINLQQDVKDLHSMMDNKDKKINGMKEEMEMEIQALRDQNMELQALKDQKDKEINEMKEEMENQKMEIQTLKDKDEHQSK